MLVAAFHAGVTGVDWLMLDDFLQADTVCVQIVGIMSESFRLLSGTAQGRAFSGHIFSGPMSWLRDDVFDALSGGTSAVMPCHVRRARVGRTDLTATRKHGQNAHVKWSLAMGDSKCQQRRSQ